MKLKVQITNVRPALSSEKNVGEQFPPPRSATWLVDLVPVPHSDEVGRITVGCLTREAADQFDGTKLYTLEITPD